jgi:hypothetical protein
MKDEVLTYLIHYEDGFSIPFVAGVTAEVKKGGR